jgi:hypothetical protein
MTNVESAAVAGDNYNLRSVLLADGTGAVVGAALGSPFPPAVYIEHPGWKEAGGRTTYSLASGVLIALMCFLGLFGLLSALIPLPAIVPILLYIGLLIGAQAFTSVPQAHAVAVVVAVIPNVASWATGQIDNVLSAASTSATKVGNDALAKAGVVYDGLKSLGGGAILAGMVLGAIVAFMIDKLLGGRVLHGGSCAVVHRPDPRRAGRLGGQSWHRTRLPVGGRGLSGVLLQQHAGPRAAARRARRRDPRARRVPADRRRTDAVTPVPEAPPECRDQIVVNRA